jgi:hypothetical protein
VNHRRRVAVPALLLVAASLPVLGGLAATPAGAAPGCVSDVPVSILTPGGCDDTTPPDTVIGTATAPRINAAGWINKAAIRVGITGVHTDADPDPLTLECVLSLEPTLPAEADWKACPEGGLFTGLQQTASKPYVLWARAVDGNDQAVAWSDGNLLTSDDEPTSDRDESPARLEFRVDTTVPNTYIFDTPYDVLTPQVPMVGGPDVPLRLAATEVASFVCTLDGTAVPCASGTNRLRGIAPGNHTFGVQAVDIAGNVDPSPASTRFAVPTNITASAKKAKRIGWKKVTNGGYLGGDYLVTSKRGSEMAIRTGAFHEVRLLATTGPRAGKIEIKVGEGWHKVDLRRKTLTRADQIQVFDEFAPKRKGKVVIRVLSQGKRVELDGILLR